MKSITETSRAPNPMRKDNCRHQPMSRPWPKKRYWTDMRPPGVLVNDKYEILHFVGQTEKYLVPPTGKPSFNILTMARQDLKYKLTTALNKAFREKTDAPKGVRIN